MAKEEKEKSEGEHKKPKLKLKSVHTHKTDDGGFVHEHHYEGKNGERHSRYGGVSSTMQDLHDHMEDHLGPGADQEPPEEPAQPQPGGDMEAAAPDAGAAPQE